MYKVVLYIQVLKSDFNAGCGLAVEGPSEQGCRSQSHACPTPVPRLSHAFQCLSAREMLLFLLCRALNSAHWRITTKTKIPLHPAFPHASVHSEGLVINQPPPQPSLRATSCFSLD